MFLIVKYTGCADLSLLKLDSYVLSDAMIMGTIVAVGCPAFSSLFYIGAEVNVILTATASNN